MHNTSKNNYTPSKNKSIQITLYIAYNTSKNRIHLKAHIYPSKSKTALYPSKNRIHSV